MKMTGPLLLAPLLLHMDNYLFCLFFKYFNILWHSLLPGYCRCPRYHLRQFSLVWIKFQYIFNQMEKLYSTLVSQIRFRLLYAFIQDRYYTATIKPKLEKRVRCECVIIFFCTLTGAFHMIEGIFHERSRCIMNTIRFIHSPLWPNFK